jgi:hypothetical protein
MSSGCSLTYQMSHLIRTLVTHVLRNHNIRLIRQCRTHLTMLLFWLISALLWIKVFLFKVWIMFGSWLLYVCLDHKFKFIHTLHYMINVRWLFIWFNFYFCVFLNEDTLEVKNFLCNNLIFVEITNTMHKFAPLLYSICWLLHVLAVVCHLQGASGSVWVTWKYRSILWFIL